VNSAAGGSEGFAHRRRPERLEEERHVRKVLGHLEMGSARHENAVRRRASFAQAPDEVDARYVAHLQVAQDHVGCEGPQDVFGAVRTVHGRDLVSLSAENSRETPEERWIVVHEENSHGAVCIYRIHSVFGVFQLTARDAEIEAGMAPKPRSPLHARIGRRLRALRQARGLTQAEVAETVGCSSHFVSGIERGVDSPSLLTLERFARALDTPVAALLEEGREDSASVLDSLARKLRGPLDAKKVVEVLREAVAAYDSGRPEKRR